MDAHRVVQILFSYTLQNSHCKALRHFSSIRAQIMEANNLVVILCVYDYLCITLLISVVVERPLQRFEDATISNNILFPELLLSILLAPSTATVLDGSKDCCRYIFVAH